MSERLPEYHSDEIVKVRSYTAGIVSRSCHFVPEMFCAVCVQHFVIIHRITANYTVIFGCTKQKQIRSIICKTELLLFQIIGIACAVYNTRCSTYRSDIAELIRVGKANVQSLSCSH